MRIPDSGQVLGGNYLFSKLSSGQFEEVKARFELVVFPEGSAVVRQGEPGDSFYTIYSGKVRVADEVAQPAPVVVAELGPGDSFGEDSLLSGTPRSHTARALTPLVVLKLGAPAFDWLLGRFPHLRDVLLERARQNTEFNFLRRLGVLSHLELPDVRGLFAEVERVRLAAGETLFRPGEPADYAYIVSEGELGIFRETGGQNRKVGAAKPGDLIGEMSLLYRQKRGSTAVAGTGCILLALGRESFDRFVSEGVRREMARQQAGRRLLQKNEAAERAASLPRPVLPDFSIRRLRHSAGWFARSYPFVPAGSPALSALACLAMLSDYHGLEPVPPEEIERRLLEDRSESLEDVSQAAEDHGFLTRMVRLDARDLRRLALPAIVELRDGAFAVVYAATRRRVVCADPSTGVRSIPMGEFAASWNGTALLLRVLPGAHADSPRLLAQLLPFARPYAWLVLWVVLLALLGQAARLADPLFSQVIIDNVLVYADRSLFALLLAALVVVTAFHLAASGLREYFGAYVLVRLNESVQLRFFHHLLSLPQKIASQWRSAAFLVRLEENERLLRLVSGNGLRLALDSTAVCFYFVFLVLLSPRLAGLGAAFALAWAGLAVVASARRRTLDTRAFERRRAAQSNWIETISGIQTIKSLSLEQHFVAQGGQLIRRQKESEFENAAFGFKISAAGDFLAYTALVAAFAYGAHLALQGAVSTGQLVAFSALLGATLSPLQGLLQGWDQISQLRGAMERTGEVLRLPAEQKLKGTLAPLLKGHVELKNVTFRYPNSPSDALAGINLEVLPGQKVAIVGRSGSGKTTLVTLLLNLYQPAAGSVLLDHVDVNNIHRSSLRRQIGVVEQNPQLFSGTVRENIARGHPEAGLDMVMAAASLAGAHEFIEKLPLGYNTPIGERGVNLSGGQKQRLVIARAVLGNPRIVVLDEATSALDAVSERIVQQNLEQILAGRTAFIINHRTGALRNADKIVVLEHGRIVEMGTHAELMDQGGFYCYLVSRSS